MWVIYSHLHIAKNFTMNTSSTPLFKSLALTFVLTLALFQLSNAQTVHENMPVTNGEVTAIVRNGNTLYLSGRFRGLGPYVPYGSSINMTTGQPDLDYVKPDDAVYAVVSDGAGGWYIGGDFTHVGGVARNHVARINADGSLNSWNPGADQAIISMAISGNTLYVGGDFSTIDGQSRNSLASFNTSTGGLKSWDPDPDGTVTAITVDGSTVYVGGSFSYIGGEYRDYLAALDASTGMATAWNPNVYADDEVAINEILINGGIAYIGGAFNEINGETRNNIGAIETATGDVTTWNPDADGIVHTMAYTTLVFSPDPGATLFVGGEFSTIGGATRYGIAALNLSSGNARLWNGYSDIDNAVFSLVVSNDLLYVGGYFGNIGTKSRNNLAALDLVNGEANSWNPSMESGVESLAVDGSGNIYAGGDFISVGWAHRTYIAAIDATTGQVTPWAPQANNYVNALAFYNNTVYAAGNFTTIGGQSRNSIAGLNTTDGLATAFNPNPAPFTGNIHCMAVANNLIYAGGSFTSMGGQSRNNLAAVDPLTGNATSWDPNASSQVDAIAITGSTAYIGGYFTSIGSDSRYHIGAVDLNTGLATSWNPGVNTNEYIYSLAVNNNTLYVGGYYTTISSQSRNNIAAFDVTTGNLTAWNPNASNGVSSFAFGNNQVYVGGGFLTIGGQSRKGLAALDPVTGNASSWNPLSSGGVGALALNNNIVYAGGTFTIVNGEPTKYFAAIDDNFVVPVGLSNLTASIANDRLSVSWITNTENNNSHFDIEISKDGNEFTKVGTVLSKTNNGNSSASLEYAFSIEMNKTLLMGLGGLMSLLLLPLFKGNKKKYIFGIAILLVAGTLLFNSGCKKIDTSGYYHGHKVMVRIVQVDKDGTKTISKVVVARIVQ